MKKLIMLVLAALVAMPAALTVSAAPVDKKTEKQMRKQCKQKTKELKKAGWEILGSARTLEGALQTHYDALIKEGEDAVEIFGTASRVKSKNAGVQMAQNNAAISYAQTQGSDIKGRLITDGFIDPDNPDAEMDKFYSAYERTVQQEITKALHPSYQLIRSNPDGTYEIEVYYIVSESAASRARLRALENGMKESEAARKLGATISDYIKAGFDTEAK